MTSETDRLLTDLKSEIKMMESRLPPEDVLMAQKLSEQGKDNKDEDFLTGVSRLAMRARAVLSVYQDSIRNAGSPLFLQLVQLPGLAGPLRKKLEAGARFFNKSTRPPKVYNAVLDAYLAYLATVWGYVGAAQTAIDSAQAAGPAAEEALTEVEGFVLVNAGGFDANVMATVAKVVAEAARVVRSHGFGSLCYGNVVVTNTLSRSTVLAFYEVKNDTMYVRANLKTGSAALETVVHELGHRYETKKTTEQKVNSLYRHYSQQERYSGDDWTKGLEPAVGEIMKDKNGEYKVVDLKWDSRMKRRVLLENVSTGSPASISLEGYLKAKGLTKKPEDRGFVSDYAGKNASENFAEMFTHYCFGKLGEANLARFKESL